MAWSVSLKQKIRAWFWFSGLPSPSTTPLLPSGFVGSRTLPDTADSRLRIERVDFHVARSTFHLPVSCIAATVHTAACRLELFASALIDPYGCSICVAAPYDGALSAAMTQQPDTMQWKHLAPVDLVGGGIGALRLAPAAAHEH